MTNCTQLISRSKAKVRKGRSLLISASSSMCPKMSCYRSVYIWIRIVWPIYQWPVPKWLKYIFLSHSLNISRICAWTCSKNLSLNCQTHADSYRCVITFSGRATNSGPIPVMQSLINFDIMYGRRKLHLRRWPRPIYNHSAATKICTLSCHACILTGYTPASTSIVRKNKKIYWPTWAKCIMWAIIDTYASLRMALWYRLCFPPNRNCHRCFSSWVLKYCRLRPINFLSRSWSASMCRAPHKQ